MENNMTEESNQSDLQKRISENTDGCSIEATEMEIKNAICSPGDTTCLNGWIHKCNSNGRWFSTGKSC
jgi:hypothetical protein